MLCNSLATKGIHDYGMDKQLSRLIKQLSYACTVECSILAVVHTYKFYNCGLLRSMKYTRPINPVWTCKNMVNMC